MAFSLGVLLLGCGTGVPAAESVYIPVSSPAGQCTEWLSVSEDGTTARRQLFAADDACEPEPLSVAARGDAGEAKGGREISPGIAAPFDGSNAGATGSLAPATPGPGIDYVDLTATPRIVDPGASSLLQWSASAADVCLASGGWSGPVDLTGATSTGALTETTTFSLTCDGPLGVSSESVTVTVDGAFEAPEVSLSAAPATVISGNASTLTWSSRDADSCTASGSWSGPLATSGSLSTGPLTETSTYSVQCTGPGGTTGASATVTVTPASNAHQASFDKITIEPAQAAWGKFLADVDGDGFLDVLEGGGSLGTHVYWYRYPDWQKFRIGTQSGGDDLQAADINGDGAVDVVVNAAPLSWYENPAGTGGNPQDAWQRHEIAGHRSHDIQIADMNADGKPDVAVRMADPTASPSTRIYLQVDEDTWTSVALWSGDNGTGGLALADIDADDRVDVVGDGYWLRQPEVGMEDGGNWQRYTIGAWPNGTSIDTADLNGDGNLDVTLAVSEVGIGAMAWFEAPDDPLTEPWIRHDIGTVEDVHRHHLVDINNDGDLDIVFAEMYQGAFDRVAIYNNDGDATSWTLQVLETHASHNLAIGDVGNDGDIDILGANWRLQAPAGGDLFLWINTLND